MTDATRRPTRERILDAAAAVMRERGLVNASVRAIVREAGCSEALLYKYFADKQELFLAVLRERLPRVAAPDGGGAELADELRGVAAALMDYFVVLFPIAGSLFGSPELLAQHREGISRHGVLGPEGPVLRVAARLGELRAAGRIRADADPDAAARLLVGAAFQQGFLAAFGGDTAVPDRDALAERLVAQLLPGLTP